MALKIVDVNRRHDDVAIMRLLVKSNFMKFVWFAFLKTDFFFYHYFSVAAIGDVYLVKWYNGCSCCSCAVEFILPDLACFTWNDLLDVYFAPFIWYFK